MKLSRSLAALFVLTVVGCGGATNGADDRSDGGQPPGETCGGEIGKQCPEGQYCSIPPEHTCGWADGPGTCKVRPEACTLESSPVCGCDGKTYGNPCTAASAGVSVARQGACEGDAAVCRPGETKKADCNTCSCGADGRWSCTLIACPACKPGETKMGEGACNVCTCIATEQWDCTGESCPPPAKFCGGWSAGTCSATEYCAYVDGEWCGAVDASSTCKPRPELCSREYVPVCGCDHKTYANACQAALAGFGVFAAGECKTPR